MKRNITKTDLKRIIGKVLNEQGTPGNSCIDPNTITYNTPQGVACLCFFDMSWSQGHQYGGHVEIEGCMQPNSNSTLSIYVNDDLRASTSGLNPGNIPGSFGTNIVWGNANTPIIRVKAVMECTGSHPACSAQNIEKTICVRRSDGQKVPCTKKFHKGDLLKHDDTKAIARNVSDIDIDFELEAPDDAEDIRESRLNEGKVCRCYGQTWYGHDGPIYCNTAQYGVQAWYAEDCCQKTMETPEGCWVGDSYPGGGDKPVDAGLSFDTADVEGGGGIREYYINRLVSKVINEDEILLNERPCGGNPLSVDLGSGWSVSFDIEPDVSVFPLNVNWGGGSYSCKFTFTFRQGPSSGPTINDADEIYDMAIQNGYSPENAEEMVEVARKKMRQIRRRGEDVVQVMDRIRARALNEMEELNEAPVCWYRRRNYANAGYTCVARRCGFSAPHKAFHPGEYDSEEDCKGSIAPPVGPGGIDDLTMAMDFDRGDKNPMGKATHVPAIPMGGGSGFGPGGVPTKPVRGRGSKATHTMWRCIAGKCTNKHGLIGGHFHTREACEKWCNRDKTPRVNN